MKEFYRNYLQNNLFFWIFSIIGVMMMIAGFILPPMGVIDNSVLIAVGEIDGFIALGAVLKAIDKGVDVTAQHNNTSITIANRDGDVGDEREEKRDRPEEVDEVNEVEEGLL